MGFVGRIVGKLLGNNVGFWDGIDEGFMVGKQEGHKDGFKVGIDDGFVEGN